MFRTVNDQPTLWDSILPPELLVLPVELSRVDALLDDPAFFAPFVAYFDARIGRPSIPMETYLRLMFLKFRYRLGYESLCREVADSISGQRFCRIPFGTRVPHPTTLMKITTRCGDAAVAGLNEALLAKAADAKLLRTDRVRVDTTVVSARTLSVRSSFACVALTSSASFNPATAVSPQRVVSFISVVGCGTLVPSGIRQNRCQEIESPTSRHNDS